MDSSRGSTKIFRSGSRARQGEPGHFDFEPVFVGFSQLSDCERRAGSASSDRSPLTRHRDTTAESMRKVGRLQFLIPGEFVGRGFGANLTIGDYTLMWISSGLPPWAP